MSLRDPNHVCILGCGLRRFVLATIDACPSTRCTPPRYSRVKRAITVPTTEVGSREMKIGS